MLHDVQWGISAGLLFAALLSIVGLLGAALDDRTTQERYGITLGSALVIYFVAGATGGLLLGLCRSLLVNRLAAALVGFVVSIPAAFAMQVALQHSASPPWQSVAAVALLGMPVAAALWRK
jgi:hypothetical protein